MTTADKYAERAREIIVASLNGRREPRIRMAIIRVQEQVALEARIDGLDWVDESINLASEHERLELWKELTKLRARLAELMEKPVKK